LTLTPKKYSEAYKHRLGGSMIKIP